MIDTLQSDGHLFIHSHHKLSLLKIKSNEWEQLTGLSPVDKQIAMCKILINNVPQLQMWTVCVQ